MNLGDDIYGHDVLTADEALMPWTLASDDVFLEQMIEAAPAPEVAHIDKVDLDWTFDAAPPVQDRIDDILARFDDGALFARDSDAVWDLADLQPVLSAPSEGRVTLGDGGGDGPEVLPATEDGPQVLPGVMDDDFLKLEDIGHRVALPLETDDTTTHWRTSGHDMVVYPSALTLNEDALYVADQGPDHGHGLIGHDDWLF